jgi:hypothetical protein
MEIWGRACSAIAAIALLGASLVAVASLRLAEAPAARPAARLSRVWRGGAFVAAAALLLSVILRGVAAADRVGEIGWSPLASVGDRAAIVALLAALLTVASGWPDLVRPRERPGRWAGWLPIAIVAAVGALDWPATRSPAPLLSLFTLGAAALGLWAVGQALDALTSHGRAQTWAPVVAFGAVTLNLLVVGAVNWRAWGAPGPTAGVSSDSFLVLLAIWLVGAAGLLLRRHALRLTAGLDLLAAVLLLGLALSVHWTLPFS